MSKMKAVVMKAPGQYEVEQVAVPVAGRNEVLVKIKGVAICGSDPKLFDGKYMSIGWPPEFPFIPGHEFAGEVVALGEGVTEFKIGERVAGEAHCGCGVCLNCKAGLYNLCLNYGKVETGHRHYGFTSTGAYAEYNTYDVKALTKLPENVSYDEATLVDTGGTALHAVELAGITVGGYSVIIGPGPIGIIAMQIAKAKGSKTIMIGRRERLQIAGKLGADFLIDYEQVKDPVAAVVEMTNGLGANEVFECAGTQISVTQAVGCAGKNGNVAIVSLPSIDEMSVPVKSVVNKQITIYGSKANPNCSKQVLELIAKGQINIKDMITHTYPIEQIKKAVSTFVNRVDGAVKVVIHP